MFGLDFLGLGSKHWKVAPSLEAFPHGWALGAFARTFGDALPNVRKFLDSGKVSAFRLQAWWSNSHKIAPIKYLKEELPRWEKLAKDYPHVKFYISHSCEYSEKSVAEVKKRVDLVKELCPSCVVVQCPMHSPVIPGVGKVEQHGTNSKPKPGHIVSTDGQACFDIDIQKWIKQHKESEIVFLWAPRFNLREAVKPPQVISSPENRTAFPPLKYINGVVALAEEAWPAPTPAFPATPLKKPELWKTFAEDGPGETDKRGNRPLIMLKKKSDFVQILTFDGKNIGRLKYYGTYGANLFRFYSGMAGAIGLYAYEIGNKAMELSGSNYIWIQQGEKVYGPICAPFRLPFYQK